MIGQICIDIHVTDTCATVRTRATYQARCKSGFEFRQKDGKYHVCKRISTRGMLYCADCLTAVPVAADMPASLLARVSGSLARVATALFS